MARNAAYAPFHRIQNKAPPGAGNPGPDLAPSLDFAGSGIQDQRWPYSTLGANGYVGGWYTEGPEIDIVPSTLSTVAIAAAQVPVAGTPLTLVSSTGSGITVLAAALPVFPAQSTVPVGALAIDGAPGYLKFGSGWISTFYDPTTYSTRNVQILSVGNDSGATFTVYGYDFYGYPMHETITGATAGNTATGKKAFKFITQIIPAGTLSGSNVSAGQGDTYGLPVACRNVSYFSWGTWNALTVTGTGTFVAPDFTTPATYTTGDVRGTYLVGSASNGTKRLTLNVQPSANLMATYGLNIGLWGQTQA